jgi:hypothetical protein
MNRARVALALLLALIALPAASDAQGVRPKSLLVYYGFPTSINSSFSVPAAAMEFGRYDHVVWGDGLDSATHPDHANAVAIIAHASTSATRIYGYVDLGVSTQNLTMTEVQARIVRWKAMGVDGVLLDDFGYDFGTGRVRQNAAVDYAHTQGLAVIANAFRSEDAFGNAIDAVYNPTGAGTHLGASDFFLYESHGVRLGEYEDGPTWKIRSDALEAYRAALGFRVFSITTTATDNPDLYSEPLFFYAWHVALLSGHEATGWGEFGFSAYGNSNGRAPFRTRPTLVPGTTFTSAVLHSGPLHFRHTNLGRINLDTQLHTYSFTAGTVDVPATGLSARPLWASPNPLRVESRIGFTLDRTQAVRLAIYDACGRRVATIATGELEAGRHERSWTGIDDAGSRVAAGSYFVALEAGGSRSVSRLVVIR